ncbi:MAG: YhbY family RNA-binding protein [Clostridia bacterium]|nr:YhbY family RNA-binding protein [Clostridia bacterium]
MLTSKQRAFLRGKANTFDVIAQVGKDGLSKACLSGLNTALNARELIKIKVLPNSGLTAREVCDEACEALGAEPVQVIGTIVVLFRKKEKDSEYDISKL